MEIKEQTEVLDAFIDKMRNIILKKGNDYATTDRLSNFKRAGEICNLTPQQNCLSLIATKVARLGVLLSGKVPDNESIEDSLIDLANYAALLYMIEKEAYEVKSEPTQEQIREYSRELEYKAHEAMAQVAFPKEEK